MRGSASGWPGQMAFRAKRSVLSDHIQFDLAWLEVASVLNHQVRVANLSCCGVRCHWILVCWQLTQLVPLNDRSLEATASPRCLLRLVCNDRYRAFIRRRHIREAERHSPAEYSSRRSEALYDSPPLDHPMVVFADASLVSQVASLLCLSDCVLCLSSTLIALFHKKP